VNGHVGLGLWLAVGAAVAGVSGTAALGLWREADRELRGPALAGLAAWLAVDIALGALGVFAARAHRVAPMLALGIAAPIVVGVWSLRRPGALSRLFESIPARSLIGVQVYRVAGVVFLLGWAAGCIPALFALPAGIGDIAVGLAAPFVAARVADGTERSRRLAIRWNIAGVADLVVAVTLGALTSPTPLWPVALGHPNPAISRLPFVLIPTFAVPLSVLLHFVTLRRLAAPGPAREPALVAQTATQPGG